MVAPHDHVAQQTSKAEPSTKWEFHNIRRDRHKRDASIRRAQHEHQQLCRYARAGAAAGPYAEFVFYTA